MTDEEKRIDHKMDSPEYQEFLKKYGAFLDSEYNLHIPKEVFRDLKKGINFFKESDRILEIKCKKARDPFHKAEKRD